jgi:FkbM family methyltransferase
MRVFSILFITTAFVSSVSLENTIKNIDQVEVIPLNYSTSAQIEYCGQVNSTNPPNSTEVVVDNLTIYVSNGRDAVSQQLKSALVDYQKHEIDEILKCINTVKKGKPNFVPTLLDIGSNLGWISLSVLKDSNANVIAFEAMADNIRLIRSSMCKNNFNTRMTLYPFGLGNKEMSCAVSVDLNNSRNGMLMCGMNGSEILRHYRHRHLWGHTSIKKLDSVIHHQIDVMKMDVEGMEYEVYKGGVNLFSSNPIRFVLMKFSEKRLKANKADIRQMFLMLGNWGYNFSTKSFSGPWIPLDKLKSFRCHACSIFLRHYSYSNTTMSLPYPR